MTTLAGGGPPGPVRTPSRQTSADLHASVTGEGAGRDQVCVGGLDGVTWGLLDPWLDDLPTISEFAASFRVGLRSCVPPHLLHAIELLHKNS